MSPLDAIRREIEIEVAALERRLGRAAPPDTVIIRVRLDRASKMPRSVEVTEERERRIQGGQVA